METVNLLGSEDVRRAGSQMASAAETIERNVVWLCEALQRHEQAMREFVERMEALAALREAGA